MRINYKRLMTKDICVYDGVKTNLKEIVKVIVLMPLVVAVVWFFISSYIIIFS